MAVSNTYNDNVFINCPFDSKYWPLFYAITFTVYRCGFYPKCSLEEDDSSEFRLSKILAIINDCKYSIHDLSRTELDEKNKLPRFNMPFELGLFWATKQFGNGRHKYKKAIILDRRMYRYQKFISDLNGIDPRIHSNDQKKVIRIVRNWLRTSSRRKGLPGDVTIWNEYSKFKKQLPKILSNAGITKEGLEFNDFCYFIEEWLTVELNN